MVNCKVTKVHFGLIVNFKQATPRVTKMQMYYAFYKEKISLTFIFQNKFSESFFDYNLFSLDIFVTLDSW